jgi:hypothetical protein
MFLDSGLAKTYCALVIPKPFSFSSCSGDTICFWKAALVEAYFPNLPSMLRAVFPDSGVVNF